MDLGHSRLVLDAEAVARFAAALACGDPVPPVPVPGDVPTIAVALIGTSAAGERLRDELAQSEKYWVHVSQSFRFNAEMTVDTPLACDTRLSRNSIGDTEMAVLELDVTRADGTPACSARSELAALERLDEILSREAPSYAERAPKGHMLAATTSVPLGIEAFEAYSRVSGDTNPIHLDEDAARAAGLPGTIAPGMLVMGRMAMLAARCSSGAAMKSLQAAFVSPLRAGARVVTECWSNRAPVDAATPVGRIKLVAHDGADSVVAIGSCSFAV